MPNRINEVYKNPKKYFTGSVELFTSNRKHISLAIMSKPILYGHLVSPPVKAVIYTAKAIGLELDVK